MLIHTQMKHRLTTLALIVVTLFLSACGDDSPLSPHFTPLAEGTIYRYHRVAIDANGTPIDSTADTVEYLVIEYMEMPIGSGYNLCITEIGSADTSCLQVSDDPKLGVDWKRFDRLGASPVSFGFDLRRTGPWETLMRTEMLPDTTGALHVVDRTLTVTVGAEETIVVGDDSVRAQRIDFASTLTKGPNEPPLYSDEYAIWYAPQWRFIVKRISRQAQLTDIVLGPLLSSYREHYIGSR